MDCLEFSTAGLRFSPLIQPLELGHCTEGGGGLLLLAFVQCLHEGQVVVVIMAVHKWGAVVASHYEAILADKHAAEEGQVLGCDCDDLFRSLVDDTHSGVMPHPRKLVPRGREGHTVDPTTCAGNNNKSRNVQL